jgi:RimJ/RimL family protein N-acetyltransferase
MRKIYKELLLTDELTYARAEKDKGRMVVICYPLLLEDKEGKKTEVSESMPSPGEFPYAVENVDELAPSYLERILNRLKGLPCAITDTQHFHIREITVEDVESLYEIYAQPEVAKYIEPLYENKEDEIAYTRDYIRYQYRFYDFGMWIVEDKENGQIVGRAGFDMREGFENPELGYVIRKEYQHKGYAYEICTSLLDYGRNELFFTQVGAFTDKRNKASVRLLKKLGFRFARTVQLRSEKLKQDTSSMNLSESDASEKTGVSQNPERIFDYYTFCYQ